MIPLPVVGWTLKDPGFRIIHNSEKLRLIITFGTLHNSAWLHLIKPKDRILVQLPCHVSDDYIKWESFLFKKHEFPADRFLFLCNSERQRATYSSVGLKAVLLNQNAFIDDEIFKPTQGVSKIYDAIYTGRPAKFKRHELAVKIGNLALIGGYAFNSVENIDLRTIPHAYLSGDKRLTPAEVNEKLQQAYCGIILSKEEGACYASSEYLLAGLPVVSTPSEGGRDFWYTPQNSVICDPTPEAVAVAVQQVVARKKAGEFDPEKIRADYLTLMEKQRALYKETIQEIAKECGVVLSEQELKIARTRHFPLADVLALLEG